MSDTSVIATLLFLLGMVLPFLYYRTLFALYKSHFEKLTGIRSSTGLNTHHHHLGLLILMLTTLVGFDWRTNYAQAFFMGLGWGLVLDEVTSSLLLPGNRTVELQVYEKSTFSTALLLGIVFILIWLVTIFAFL